MLFKTFKKGDFLTIKMHLQIRIVQEVIVYPSPFPPSSHTPLPSFWLVYRTAAKYINQWCIQQILFPSSHEIVSYNIFYLNQGSTGSFLEMVNRSCTITYKIKKIETLNSMYIHLYGIFLEVVYDFRGMYWIVILTLTNLPRP